MTHTCYIIRIFIFSNVLSGDSSFRAPMAVSVIGGLFTSTLLSLIVVPAAFTVLDDLGGWVKRRGKRKQVVAAA